MTKTLNFQIGKDISHKIQTGVTQNMELEKHAQTLNVLREGGGYGIRLSALPFCQRLKAEVVSRGKVITSPKGGGMGETKLKEITGIKILYPVLQK